MRAAIVVLALAFAAVGATACGESSTTTTIVKEASADRSAEKAELKAEEAEERLDELEQQLEDQQKADNQPSEVASAPLPAEEAPPESGGVPFLVGDRLDIAKRKIKEAGFRARVSGGGFFGVVVDQNWVVCSQKPSAGESLAAGSKVDVNVDRSC
jgi:beta-lactam-binding protein with PASTA domain